MPGNKSEGGMPEMTRVANVSDFADPRAQLAHEFKLTNKMEQVAQMMTGLAESKLESKLSKNCLQVVGFARRSARQRIDAIDIEVPKLLMIMQPLLDGWDVDLAVLKELDKIRFRDALKQQVGDDAMVAASKRGLSEYFGEGR